MDLPELSVVVTSYNRPREVTRALGCLESQTLPRDRFEVLVVDDGSGGETRDVLEAFRARSPLRLTVHCKENGGPASARNAGIGRAAGPLVVLLQDDIFACPELLARHAGAHARRQGPRVVLGQTRWSRDLPRTPFMDFLMEGDQFAFQWIADPEDVPYNFFYSSNVSFPRDAAERVGMFDEAFPYAAWEDTDLGLRFARAGVRMVYEPDALAEHHHPTTLPSYLGKRRQIGIASTILYRKHPETAAMMRYDRRPAPWMLRASAPACRAVAAILGRAERRGWDHRLPVALRRRLYRALLDGEYFQGVAAGLAEGASVPPVKMAR